MSRINSKRDTRAGFSFLPVVAILASVLAFSANAQVPAAPTIGAATAGNAQVSVTFTPPSRSGGSAITQYVASCNVAGATRGVASGTASPLTVTGLANGMAVTCRVAARNATGVGPVSADSNSVMPAAPAAAASPPAAPVIGAATAGNGQVSVSFNAPSNAGGFVAVCRPVDGDLSKTRTGRGPASPLTVAGLANGTAYTCTVAVATGGPLSAASNSVTPVAPAAAAPSKPGAPVIGTATAFDAAVRVNFTAPGSDGGAPISGYTATCNDKTATGTGWPLAAVPSTSTSRSLMVTGLTNGKPYNCIVSATNSAGTGPASAVSNSAMPNAPAAPGSGSGVGVRNNAPPSGG